MLFPLSLVSSFWRVLFSQCHFLKRSLTSMINFLQLEILSSSSCLPVFQTLGVSNALCSAGIVYFRTFQQMSSEALVQKSAGGRVTAMLSSKRLTDIQVSSNEATYVKWRTFLAVDLSSSPFSLILASVGASSLQLVREQLCCQFPPQRGIPCHSSFNLLPDRQGRLSVFHL